jgi:hypothetical protein
VNIIGHLTESAYASISLYQSLIGNDIPNWIDVPDFVKNEFRSSVVGVLSGQDVVQNHNARVDRLTATGWRFGPAVDKDRKLHPSIVSYENAGQHDRVMGVILVTTVQSMCRAFRVAPPGEVCLGLIRDLGAALVIEGEMRESDIEDFVRYCQSRTGSVRYGLSWGATLEWRFQGSLGHGGKLYIDAQRVRVGMYPEDATPERDRRRAYLNRVVNSLARAYGLSG